MEKMTKRNERKKIKHWEEEGLLFLTYFLTLWDQHYADNQHQRKTLKENYRAVLLVSLMWMDAKIPNISIDSEKAIVKIQHCS